MKRKEFLKQCGFACLGVMGVSSALSSCSPIRSISGQLSDKRLSVPLLLFDSGKVRKTAVSSYIVIRNEALNYPLVVYKSAAGEYTALLLRCTHQYNELNVSGEMLSCPAHGSEFNTKGEPINGPAELRLKQFVTSTDTTNLYIDLV